MPMKLIDVASQSGVAFGTSGARGLVLAMSDHVCAAYTQSFLSAFAEDAAEIVLGHDLRPSSPAIAQACACAIREAGKKVIFVGALPTPAVAYYASLRRAPAIVVTGSHIPFDRNGIKFYRVDGEISKADEAMMLTSEVVPSLSHQLMDLPVVLSEAADAYVERYLKVFGADALLGKRVAVYEHSSVARDLLKNLLSAMGATVISLGRTDTFVPIDTEAVRPEDVEQARVWAQAYGFDAIVSTDGDADRPLIGDENGNWLRGDVVGVLCAQALNADIVVTPVSSNSVAEKCESFDKVIRTRIGSPDVIAAMEEAVRSERAGIVVAGYEANGGFLLGSNVEIGQGILRALPTRDAALPMLTLLATAARLGLPLSELSKTLPARFTASDRIQNFPTAVSRKLLEVLATDKTMASHLMGPESGAVVSQDLTDGLRVTFESGEVVHLRPSGNAPELRCYAEAGNEQKVWVLCRTCLARVEQNFK